MSHSNQNKPKLTINVKAPPPALAPNATTVAAIEELESGGGEIVAAPTSPLVAAKHAPAAVVRKNHANLLAKFPPPWVVGPYGDVWVAADVEQFDGEGGIEKIQGPNGTWWRSTCAKPRHIFEPTDAGIAAFTVDAVNALLG